MNRNKASEIPTVVSIFGRNPSYVGAVELFARELSDQLGAHGWRSVLVFSAPPSEAVAQLLKTPNVCVEVIRQPCANNHESMRCFMRILRFYRPRIVHMYFTGFVGPYPWLARLFSVPHVMFNDQTSRPENHTIHRARWPKRVLTRVINHPLNTVICASEFGRRCMRGLDVLPADRYELVYNAVDIDRADRGASLGPDIRRRFGIPEGRVVVAQTSWMIPEKGWADLLHAARSVVRQNGNVHFLMVGDGPDRAGFIDMARIMNIESHVTWTGVVDDPLGTGLYAAADIVCQVSRWQELFGFTIAEAMAARRPVIGTRVGGIPELIENGETGYLVERGDVDSLARRILELAADPAKRQQFGQAGRDAVECRFNLSKNVDQLLRVYGMPVNSQRQGECILH